MQCKIVRLKLLARRLLQMADDKGIFKPVIFRKRQSSYIQTLPDKSSDPFIKMHHTLIFPEKNEII